MDGVWVGVGSRDESPTLSGASHFLEHLLFKGTDERSALDISIALDAVGGEFNAFTAKEYTCFHARVLDDDLPLAVDVLGDMLTSSTISTADVEAERAVILDEIAMHDDDPDDVVHNLYAETAWAGTPLGRPIADLFPAQMREAYLEHICTRTPTKPGAPSSDETRAQVETFTGLRAENGEFPIEASISCLELPTGRLYTIIARDVSERKRREDEQARSLGLLRDAVDDLAPRHEVSLLTLHDPGEPPTEAHLARVREALGGGKSWFPSTGKRAAPGASLDIPLAHKDALYVRSHYDTVSVTFTDSPGPNEVLVAVAVATRGRLHARLGGLKADEIVGTDGLH